MAGALITSDFQIQLGPDSGGLLLGAGTPYDVIELDGWDDLPPYSLTDVMKPTEPGGWTGPMYPQPRVITLTVQVAGTVGMIGASSAAQYAANVAALRAVTAPASDSTVEMPMAVRLAGQVLVANVRCQQRVMPVTLGYASPGSDKVTLQLAASDPRRYAQAVQSASCGLYAVTGGLTYPIHYPLTWGSVSSTGTLTIINAGDTATPPTLRIQGPANTPTITRQDTGAFLLIDLVLSASDTVTVDVLDDELLLNGVSVYAALDPSGNPIGNFLMQPGSTPLGLAVASGVGTTLSATWQSAYL